MRGRTGERGCREGEGMDRGGDCEGEQGEELKTHLEGISVLKAALDSDDEDLLLVFGEGGE